MSTVLEWVVLGVLCWEAAVVGVAIIVYACRRPK
jgi:hypothetical protein